MLFPTTLVGSYAQPDWLIDRAALSDRSPPRVRRTELWRIGNEFLEQAQDDATLLAIRDQERAGIDIVSDGEIRRESYSNAFANALEGLDLDNPGTVTTRTGKTDYVPRVVGRVRRKQPVSVRDVKFLRANTDRKVKINVPGPFTMSLQAQDEHYKDPIALAMDYAAAVNEEIKDLFAAGADVVQLDEPWLQAQPAKAREFGIKAVTRALEGVKGTTAIHLCFGYGFVVAKNNMTKPNAYSFLAELEATPVNQISIETAETNLDLSALKDMPSKSFMIGVIDLSKPEIETAKTVAERIERATKVVAPERIVVAPDCGFKYLPRAVAYAKMKAMVDGAKLARG